MKTMIGSVPTLPQSMPTVGLRGWRLWSARVAWLLTAGILLVVYGAQLSQHLYSFRLGEYNWMVVESYPVVARLLPRAGFAAYTLTLQLAATVFCLAVAVLLAWRRPDHWMALLASLLLMWAPLGFNLVGYTEYYELLPWRWWPLLNSLRAAAGLLGITALLLLCLLFPDGHFAPGWMKWALVPLGLVVLGAVALELWAPPLGWEVLMLLVVGIAIAALASQVYRYRRLSGTAQRQQTRFVVLALALLPAWMLLAMLSWMVVPAAARPLVNFINMHLALLVLVLMPLAFGIAVLRHNLWDVNPIVRRTLIYASLTVLVGVLYVALVAAAASLFDLGDNPTLAMVVLAAVAVLAFPLYRRLQRSVNRYLYGERDAPTAVLARLEQRLEAVATAADVLPAITTTVGQALKLPYVAVVLLEDGAARPLAVYPDKVSMPGTKPADWAAAGLSRIPLRFQGEVIGELWAAPRTPGERLTSADMALLGQVAAHAGPALYAVRLTADLQQSRERIVHVAAAERRRLHRDLHDGLGPQLASLVLQIDAARNWLERDPQRADLLLVDLKHQVQAAIGDVRQLVYDLYPPALEQVGLVAALTQYAGRASNHQLQITVEAPAPLPPLDAAVEVAAYRIALEAVANVAHHAAAQHCWLRLRTTEGWLMLAVADDGSGIAGSVIVGVGLRSMRERAAEVGGVLHVEQAPEGGVLVRAELPLASPVR